MRTIEPSPIYQRMGKPDILHRFPTTLAISPPTFSQPRRPFLINKLWHGSHSGSPVKIMSGSFFVLFTNVFSERAGSMRPMAVCRGWSNACWSTPTALALCWTNHHRLLCLNRVNNKIICVITPVFVPAGMHNDDITRFHW